MTVWTLQKGLKSWFQGKRWEEIVSASAAPRLQSNIEELALRIQVLSQAPTTQVWVLQKHSTFLRISKISRNKYKVTIKLYSAVI